MIIKDNKDNKIYRVEEGVEKTQYEKDMEDLEFYKKKFEESEVQANKNETEQDASEYNKSQSKPRARIDDLMDNKSDMMSTLSWIAFGIGIVPFFPYKTIISLIGILLGYLHYNNHKGSKAPMVANISILALRGVIWMLVLLSFPLLAWRPLLRF